MTGVPVSPDLMIENSARVDAKSIARVKPRVVMLGTMSTLTRRSFLQALCRRSWRPSMVRDTGRPARGRHGTTPPGIAERSLPHARTRRRPRSRRRVARQHRPAEGTRRPAAVARARVVGLGIWRLGERAGRRVARRQPRDRRIPAVEGGPAHRSSRPPCSGQLDVVKAFVAAQPGVQKTWGPHGITLLSPRPGRRRSRQGRARLPDRARRRGRAAQP